ncbi:hypothetical protein I204_04343 [Kwoniella mangroviensis CBS 8886]|uniref:uncharacterized protein n=1 Tax=Kwoniella mangroviensis CBS 8507 TaxID=1296122 RepID=UPI00080CD57A|nr:uncharacterized protein I203_03047 [Kwoniella mangroviensis CBS 8507]OCF67353.1 hypothetical protein I203_03047 [Kwoniella mangroviensis CBS 8507]OCF75487.1 hypothetical protein I204_04343 [Kwoniella mangroviensis CBS 8886]
MSEPKSDINRTLPLRTSISSTTTDGSGLTESPVNPMITISPTDGPQKLAYLSPNGYDADEIPKIPGLEAGFWDLSDEKLLNRLDESEYDKCQKDFSTDLEGQMELCGLSRFDGNLLELCAGAKRTSLQYSDGHPDPAQWSIADNDFNSISHKVIEKNDKFGPIADSVFLVATSYRSDPAGQKYIDFANKLVVACQSEGSSVHRRLQSIKERVSNYQRYHEEILVTSSRHSQESERSHLRDPCQSRSTESYNTVERGRKLSISQGDNTKNPESRSRSRLRDIFNTDNLRRSTASLRDRSRSRSINHENHSLIALTQNTLKLTSDLQKGMDEMPSRLCQPLERLIDALMFEDGDEPDPIFIN